MQNSISNANYHFRKAFDLTNRFIEFDSLAAKIAYNLGVTWRMLGNPEESTIFLTLSHDYFKNKGDLRRLATTMYEQGIVLDSVQERAKAAEYFSEARGIFHALNMRHFASIVQQTMASTITVQEDPLLAIDQLLECLPIFIGEKNDTALVFVYAKIANIHLSLGNYEDAMKPLNQATVLIETKALHDTPETAQCYQSFAQYHFQCQNYEEAIHYALKSASAFGTMDLIIEQVDSLEIVSDCYIQLGDYKQAFTIERKCNLLQKSLRGRRELTK